MKRPDTIRIVQWNRAQEVGRKHELVISVRGDVFMVARRNGISLGHFETIAGVYNFILGYDWGQATRKRGRPKL